MKKYRIVKYVYSGRVYYSIEKLVSIFWGLIKYWNDPLSGDYGTTFSSEEEARIYIRKQCSDMNYSEIIPVDNPCDFIIPEKLPPGAIKPANKSTRTTMIPK